ncbi:hypothetical protein [Segeticoccus rhizosphaerae]|jgi:hypothetical protein|uniref:hypothetical protein n=1 Tax=Segeticoccus rhizosphaerae TaxID=1104777 RepID=UPI0010C090DD|nr:MULTISPECIES: hypothetical protein [Intrasporangiaceae]
MVHRRTAGIGLFVFGLGTLVTFMTAEIPGGDYEPVKVTAYLAQGHALRTFVLAYVGIASMLALLVFAHGIRDELGRLGEFVWGLSIAAVATGVVGWFIGAGVVVATAEGGPDITAGIPLPVAHTIGEIAGLLGGCAPALFIGVVAIMLWRTDLPLWLRGFSVVAGVCGILAPLFFTLFVFVLWTLVCGVSLMRLQSSPATIEPILQS